MGFFSCDPAKSHICVVFHGWKKAHHSVDILCTAVDLVKGQQQYWPFHFLHRADVFLNPKLTRKRVSELKLGCVWGMLSIMVPERVVFLLSFFFFTFFTNDASLLKNPPGTTRLAFALAQRKYIFRLFLARCFQLCHNLLYTKYNILGLCLFVVGGEGIFENV